MDADKWLTLPDDLLVDILRRLDASAVIRCAGACKLWRRAIVNNASCLRPRPDRFLPDLLLGFFEKYLRLRRHLPWQLQYVPASNSAVPFPVPATGICVDGSLYNDLLSSRDGFLLLGEDNGGCDSLCLCNAHTGVCRVLPVAEFDNNSFSTKCMYVLATGYDADDDDYSTSDFGDETAVWILAVDWDRVDDARDGMIYQIFSTTSGAWGPVKCSVKFPEDVAIVLSNPTGPWESVVVCHGAVTVSWFVVYLFPDSNAVNCRTRKCIFSMDLRTERTWTTELPDSGTVGYSHVLAVSEDGRLSLVKMLSSSHQMEVWVLVGDGDGDGGQWELRRTIHDMQKLLPNCPAMAHMWLSGFCPRSGYLFGAGGDAQNVQHHFLIGVDGSSPRLIGTVDEFRNSASWFPYEMDWSTYISSYISKMKYF